MEKKYYIFIMDKNNDQSFSIEEIEGWNYICEEENDTYKMQPPKICNNNKDVTINISRLDVENNTNDIPRPESPQGLTCCCGLIKLKTKFN